MTINYGRELTKLALKWTAIGFLTGGLILLEVWFLIKGLGVIR